MTHQLKKLWLFFINGFQIVIKALKITFKAMRIKFILWISFVVLFLLHLYILPAHILGMDIGLNSF